MNNNNREGSDIVLTTELMLYGKYKKPVINLSECCEEVLGLCYKNAREAARRCELPFPVVRTRNTRHAPYLVHIRDLARYLDSTFEDARKDFDKL
ncbi:pyocin activator PrtN family protein [Endozoicomonas elysicola]|nr:pyocin activator PrtN family protein [Endozoicomonas elysicola]